MTMLFKRTKLPGITDVVRYVTKGEESWINGKNVLRTICCIQPRESFKKMRMCQLEDDRACNSPKFGVGQRILWSHLNMYRKYREPKSFSANENGVQRLDVRQLKRSICSRESCVKMWTSQSQRHTIYKKKKCESIQCIFAYKFYAMEKGKKAARYFTCPSSCAFILLRVSAFSLSSSGSSVNDDMAAWPLPPSMASSPKPQLSQKTSPREQGILWTLPALVNPTLW